MSTIEGDAFESCTSLESIAVDESNSHYESVDGVLFNQEKTVLIQYPSGKSGAYEVPGTVKTIRDSSFKSCAGLTDVTLNEGLETIGLYAFRSSGLTSISVPSTVTMIYTGAFRSCHNLSSIGVDEANTKYCSVDGVLLSKDKTSLKECPAGKAGAFVAPDEVKRVEIYAFYYCSELTSVTFGSNVTLIGSYSFTGCPVETVTLPDSVQMIDYYAFSDCGLKSIVIPDNIESLRYVFYNCRDLSSVTLPSELKIIGSYAFYNCRSLTSIDIPEKVTTLDNYAFYNCDGLESVRLPATVATVGDGVFGNCDNLMRIDADDANASFTSSGGVLFSKNMKTLVQYPCAITGDYAIPTGVEKIQAYAFCGSKASSVSIPDTVTSVGNRAFQNCVNLTSMEIPASVASIGDRVFYVSYNIESIDVDDGNTSYHSIDGVLFDTGKKKLMLFPEAKVGTFTIPGDVTVDEYAFNNVCLAPGVVPAAGVTINTTGHDYEAVFAFSEDFKTCEITLTCRNNPDHVISTTVTTVIDGDDATATYVYHGMTYTKTVSMTDDPSDPDDDSGSKAPLFIGIGAVVGILAVAGAVVFIRRR